MNDHKMYINGEFVRSRSGKKMEVRNPATGEVIATVPEAGAEDVEAAIQAARRAFDEGAWRESTGQQRGRVLFQIAEALRREAKRLADLETLNMGKPLVESEFDIADAATCFEYFGGWATKIFGEVNPVPDQAFSFTVKEPVGVCGLIIPWNYPILMAAWKLAPALAAGCTMILKPAEDTPLTAIELAKLLDGIADLPKGVVNVVTGYGEVAGATLARSRSVDKVAFTGSTEVGRSILRAAADTNLKKVTLELGGKSPNIFFADSDFEAAVDGALFGVFINQGEVCSAGSRILVERSIHKKFVEAMREKAKKIVLGPGLEPASKMGPLVSANQLARVESYIQAGVQEGAKLVMGGKRPNGKLAKGYFIEPTIFDDVKNSMKIAREEIFGPVAAVIPFEKEEEAIRVANQTDYGLAAAVWTRDIFKAFRVVKQIRAGTVWINHMQPCYVEGPWGGYKMSGTGRELGKYGIENFLESKQVYLNLNEAPIGWY
ncbi:MAG: aldehyde dehydrogenase family protein [Deltaproteobacteria bacterium]|nr:aldehyde dehydrogenase family protein [Deltaproteobacteria bacterium]